MSFLLRAYRRIFSFQNNSIGTNYEDFMINFNGYVDNYDLSRESVGKRRNTIPKVQHTAGEPVIHIKSLIDDIDICHLRCFSSCVKAYYPSQFINREFIENPVRYFGDEVIYGTPSADIVSSIYGGGNDVVFLGGFMQKVMPKLLDYILQNFTKAAVEAGWYPHINHLGIRCVESLIYSAGGKLMLHTDSESVFTIVLMLSDPSISDFTGGDFVIQKNSLEGTNLLHVSLNVGDAIMFDSNSLHGVEAVLTGERNVLVLELWPYADSVRGEHRPAASLYSSRLTLPKLLQERNTRTVDV